MGYYKNEEINRDLAQGIVWPEHDGKPDQQYWDEMFAIAEAKELAEKKAEKVETDSHHHERAQVESEELADEIDNHIIHQNDNHEETNV